MSRLKNLIGKGRHFEFLNKGVTVKMLYLSKIRRPSGKKTGRFKDEGREAVRQGWWHWVWKEMEES